MRIGMVSALCVLALLICSPRPAAAQSNPASPQTSHAFLQNEPSAPKLSDLPKSAESGAVDFRQDSKSAPTNALELRTNKKLFLLDGQQHATNGIGMQAPIETNSCAHILIYKAPAVDSKMIIEVPTESTGDKPKLGGLQVCREDVRMAAMATPGRPRVAPKPDLSLLPVLLRP
jgi:hypothetical protein